VAVAAKIGFEPVCMFKTLVTEGKTTGLNVFVVPSNVELDLKKAAQAAGDKYVEMLKSRELEPKNGLCPRRLLPGWNEKAVSDVH
jgi:Cys-tRNA(Pro)/Cys-tRNA(Cys) deacylase